MGILFILIMVIAILIGINSIKDNTLIKKKEWIDYIPKELRKRYRR